MSRLAPLRVLGLALLTLLAVAFATGTAVRAAPTLSEIRLEAYQLQGGLLADLCGHDAPDHTHIAGCSLCHLVASAALPDISTTSPRLERLFHATVILPNVRRAEDHARDPAIPPRGPPAV